MFEPEWSLGMSIMSAFTLQNHTEESFYDNLRYCIISLSITGNEISFHADDKLACLFGGK